MSTTTKIRWLASVGLVGVLVGAGYFYMVVSIRQTYFPDERNGHLWVVMLALFMLAVYFTASIRRGRFIWIMPGTKGQKT